MQRLGAAEQSMSLTMPGRGVQTPTLGFNLDPFQVQALDELGQNTRSPNNAGNALDGRVSTPREGCRVTPRDRGSSAFTPVRGDNYAPVAAEMRINPPHLPGHDFMLPGVDTGSDFGIRATGPNIGIRSTDAATSRQQTLISAGSIGERVVFPAGTRSRNPDQVDVLHLMNQQMIQGITHLNSMVPTQNERRMAQLKGAIAGALQRMAQYNALGMDTSAMSHCVTALENKLHGMLNSMFSL
jgi:hypothetical protein